MVEITRINFMEMLPRVKKSIDNSSFVSIDAEFSGLELMPSNEISLFDTNEERYKKLKARASNFIPCQIGVSLFRKDENKNMYFAETFTFFIRPHLCGHIDRRWQCQASSFDFLSFYNFDFNKFARDGIPYLNEEEERQVRNEIINKVFTLPHQNLIDSRYRRQQDLLLSDFLMTSKEGDKLTLPRHFMNHEYFQLMELRQKYPCLWAHAENNDIVVEHVSAERKIELEMSIAEEEERLLQDFLGFTLIFRILKASQKPIIGHNLLMDLLLIFYNFHKPFPKLYRQFKLELNQIFPLIFDTRYIWLHVKKVYGLSMIPKESGLFDLYEMFKSPPEAIKILFSPCIQHVNGDEYTSSGTLHDSGFDSYVTGFVFIKICHLLAMKKTPSTVNIQPQTLKQYLKIMSPCANKLNISKSRFDYMNVAGDDPEPNVSEFLHLSLKNRQQRLNLFEINELFGKYGAVEVKLMGNKKEGIIVTRSNWIHKKILNDFKDHNEFWIEKYSIIRHYWPIKSALWLSFLGGACVMMYVISKRFHVLG